MSSWKFTRKNTKLTAQANHKKLLKNLRYKTLKKLFPTNFLTSIYSLFCNSEITKTPFQKFIKQQAPSIFQHFSLGKGCAVIAVLLYCNTEEMKSKMIVLFWLSLYRISFWAYWWKPYISQYNTVQPKIEKTRYMQNIMEDVSACFTNFYFLWLSSFHCKIIGNCQSWRQCLFFVYKWF